MEVEDFRLKMGEFLSILNIVNSSGRVILRCIKCKHQKVDHHRTAARDKMNV
jgi:hypothetical protein